MPDTIPVTFDLDRETAAALADPATRERVARLVADAVRPAPGVGEDRAAVTAEDGRAAAVALVAEFREFRRGQTLGGIPIRDLIAEGRR